MGAEDAAGEVLRLDDAAAVAILPARDPAGHKGSHGTLLCLVGSARYAGAALLVASSAVRGGAGLVALAVPASVVPLVAGRVPEAITLALPEADDDVEPAGALEVLTARPAEALAVGCGLAESEGNRRLLVELLSQPGTPAVVDGGALNLLAAERGVWRGIGRTCILTPHPGEFARLTGQPVGSGTDERVERAREAASAFGQLVVLKGARTVVAAPDGRSAVAPFANPALGSAGTGDVLAGLIGALLAQGLAPWEAACLGVYLHGRAGERVRERLGEAGPVASDLPLEIAYARRALAGGRRD